MSAAENVSEALTLLMHYCRIVNESVRLKLAPQPDGMLVDSSFSGIARPRIRQNAEFQLAVVVQAIREFTGLNVCPTRVACAHGRTTDVKEFERFFGCPVEFAASSDQIGFSNETLALPLITEDPHLLETLRPFCEVAARARNTTHGTAAAARPRSSGNRRQGAGGGFENAYAQARRGRHEFRRGCRRPATQPRRPISPRVELTLAQIGWFLGYEGPTSFHHAFKRWTGRSPSLARSETRLLAPG
jgi:AraC-like DNA-binding protein